MHLLARRRLLQEFLVARLEPVWGHRRFDQLLDISLLDQVVLVKMEAALHRRVLVEMLLAPGLGDQLAVDQPVEQNRIDLLERQLLQLGRQALLRGFHIGQMQLGPIDAGDDGARRRQSGRRRRSGRGCGWRSGGGGGNRSRRRRTGRARGPGGKASCCQCQAEHPGKGRTRQHLRPPPGSTQPRGWRSRTRPSMHIDATRTSRRMAGFVGNVGGGAAAAEALAN